MFSLLGGDPAHHVPRNVMDQVTGRVFTREDGHSRTSFTDGTYVHLFPEAAAAAAEAAAAVVPRTREGSA